MMAVLSSDSFTVDNREVRMKKGPLVKVDLGNGRWVKKYQADAIAEGLIPAPASTGSASTSSATGQKAADAIKGRPAGNDKALPAGQDKMRRPEENKQQATDDSQQATTVEADDFTFIDGVGRATARALVAHGITTFKALRTAGQLDFLNAPTNAAIEAWRKED